MRHSNILLPISELWFWFFYHKNSILKKDNNGGGYGFE